MATVDDTDWVNIYCVGPPLQILGAIEARDRFPADQHVIVVRKASLRRAEHNRQVEAILDLERWDEIITWPARRKGSRLTRSYSPLRRFAYSLKRRFRGKSMRLLMGGFNQFSSHLMRSQLQPDHTVMLDDGVATLHHFENHLSRNQYYPDWATAYDVQRGIRQRVRAVLTGISFDVLSEPIDLFTCFDIRPPSGCKTRISRHSFEKLAESSRNKKVVEQQVFYFGSPLSEYRMLELDFETAFVGAAFDHYQSLGMVPVYIPHRDDSHDKLNSLLEAGHSVRPLNMPAEVYFATAEQLPACIASSGSTVLHNINMISPSTRVEMLPIPQRYYLRKKEAMALIKKHYQSIGIKIIQLDFAS